MWQGTMFDFSLGKNTHYAFFFFSLLSSRMDSTGENWKIQVPDYTAQLLTTKGYTCVVCVLCTLYLVVD